MSNLFDIPKPYSYKRKYLFIICKYELIYEDTIIRTYFAASKHSKCMDELITILNSAFEEGYRYCSSHGDKHND
jgi:hypothetical protein